MDISFAGVFSLSVKYRMEFLQLEAEMKRKINYAPTLDITSFQLTEGCSHNKCTFCSMFHSIPFHAISMDEIKSDLREASDYSTNIDRVFLSDGDAFVLPANQLLEIASLIHKYLPRVSAISSYASK